MGVGLLIGAQLARLRRYRWHAWCQSLIVLLNPVLIALAMWPAFHGQILPKLPSRIGKPYYALAAGHAALGGVAEVAECISCWQPERRYCPRSSASSATSSGCEVFLWFGGWFFSSELQPTLAGT